MGRSEEKRARIIAEQAAREAADRAAGRFPLVTPTTRGKAKAPMPRRSPWPSKPKPK